MIRCVGIALAILAIAVPARAEIVTLVCGDPQKPSQVGNLTLAVDMSTNKVTFLAGNPPRTVDAQVNAGLIEFDNPYLSGWRHQINRTTGGFMTYISEEKRWAPAGSCERASKPLL